MKKLFEILILTLKLELAGIICGVFLSKRVDFSAVLATLDFFPYALLATTIFFVVHKK